MPPLPNPPSPPPPLNAVERSIKQEPQKPFIHLSKFYNKKKNKLQSLIGSRVPTEKKEKSINLTVLHYSVVIRIQQIFVAGTNLSCAFSNALATRDRKI